MKRLLSLPPNLVDCFHEVERVSRDEFFCTSDPIGKKLGSGGGTTWLLEECQRQTAPQQPFNEWLASEKRILLHAGGQSRRLPSYAPSGKILTPIPVFRWAKGQCINQNLLSLQLPLYERIMKVAPKSLHTLVASGDMLVRAGKLQVIPEADVVCYGLWVDPSLAKGHGVFVSSREHPERLDFMLQKPSIETMAELLRTHYFLMDIGIWLLSDRAVEMLRQRSHERGAYDLYSEFGCALGEHPTLPDDLLSQLSVAILPLNEGEFYHYGTSREMISSTLAIQNLVNDQRSILHVGMRPHPSIFIQNAHNGIHFCSSNHDTWIENSWIGEHWTLSSRNIITGVPKNDWNIELNDGVCVDVVPMKEGGYALRPYGIEDAFRGPLSDESTTYLAKPASAWLQERGLDPADIMGNHDLQAAQIFPISDDMDVLGDMLYWMVTPPHATDAERWERGARAWKQAKHICADDISNYANLVRLCEQRRAFMAENLKALADNHQQSVFYQTDLKNMAELYAEHGLGLPAPLSETEPLLKRISNRMLRSQLLRLNGADGVEEEASAFRLLSEGLTQQVLAEKQQPVSSVYSDQIVWGRSPVRIDIAGGWTDTPPYCLSNGGNVVNLAIELNGQPPLQTYVKPCKEFKIVLRSIDLGAMEEVRTFDELHDFARVGSPFSIPKAALCLAGFHPDFCLHPETSLERQLKQFGSGIEVTLLSAIPAGSGLGTSSILSATVLGTLSDFCGLSWDKAEIANRTLVLEQLLTTGGGWQDQYGGVLPGVKLLRTHPGFDQTPSVRWLPGTLFSDAQYAPCHLLYYTGITRTAKNILAEIVRGMFLSEHERLQLLNEMKEHSFDLYHAILAGKFEEMGRLIAKTWQQNQELDAGTNPESVRRITTLIDDLCLGYKLPGAGGGGYLYMVAKDPEAAMRIRTILKANNCNPNARFVDMSLSMAGLQVSRS
ncbi:MAG: bifunctional fucokinase/L-fucose-1-P-guanylyltransferase [Bacteroidales bacterium]|nr:bifunctional fucokinase/L-fucose-1-P-guanylyltransferase [Candidatus Physcousia equi]